jgi:hypothetical protein
MIKFMDVARFLYLNQVLNYYIWMLHKIHSIKFICGLKIFPRFMVLIYIMELYKIMLL